MSLIDLPRDNAGKFTSFNSEPEAVLEPAFFRDEATPGQVSHLRELHPWLSEAAAARVALGTPSHASAAPTSGYEDEGDDEDILCAHCGEPVMPNLDGTRGLWGHVATEDPACMNSERAASLAYRYRLSALDSAGAEGLRLDALADEHEVIADMLRIDETFGRLPRTRIA